MTRIGYQGGMAASYLALLKSGELARRAEEALQVLADCTVCPRLCHVDRLEDEVGFCRTGRRARVSSWNLHFGEEEPLVGEGGSGTIFFAMCNLACVFCQNYDISQEAGDSDEVPAEVLAGMMLRLQEQGAHNINFVTPSHVVPQILEALVIAAGRGLVLPLVYNTSGYDTVETLRLLDGVVDIYMPDTKFWDPAHARRYCAAPDYPERARAAIAEMHRQVGDLTMDEHGVAARGLLVRHLVMPGGTAGTRHWAEFLAGLSRDTYVNVMGQYRPCGQAHKFEELCARVGPKDMEQAEAEAREAGLHRFDERTGGLVRFLMRHMQRGE